MNNWDEGYVKIDPNDLQKDRMPAPPAEPRIVLYEVQDTDPSEYLLMGRLLEAGSEQKVLLRSSDPSSLKLMCVKRVPIPNQ